MRNKTQYEPADIVIYIQGKGYVLKEKSLLAFNNTNEKVIAIGTEAEHLLENTPENVIVISPLRQGMVTDNIDAVHLFTGLLRKALGKRTLLRPAVVIYVPKGITYIERKTIEDVLVMAGAKEPLMFTDDIPLKQLIEEMPVKYPDIYRKYKIVIGITKDEPEKYIEEELENILRYAEQEGISHEQVAELLHSLRKT